MSHNEMTESQRKQYKEQLAEQAKAHQSFIEFRDAFIAEFSEYLLQFDRVGTREEDGNTLETRDYYTKVPVMEYVHAPYAYDMIKFAYNYFNKKEGEEE